MSEVVRYRSPNQRAVKIKKSACNTDNLYMRLNLSALEEAVIDLKDMGSLKLYLYLAKNQDGHTLLLSPGAFCDWADCSVDCYKKAVRTLIDKHYLISPENNNNFIFMDKKETAT